MGQAKEEPMKIIPALNSSGKARDVMKVFARKIRFDLRGEGNAFNLEIDNGQMKVGEDTSGDADIIVTGDPKEFAKVISAGVDVTHPIAFGHIVITKGKVSEMTLLNRILWATRGT